MDRILYKGAKEIKESDMTLCFVVCPRRSVRSAMWKKRGMWTRRRFGRSGWDKTMRKGRGQGEDSERAGRDKTMRKGRGQGEDSGGAGRDKRMTKGRGQGEDSEGAGRDKTMRKECGQGEIENIGGKVKLGYNQVRREKN